MVNFCSVFGCSNRSGRDLVSFHCIPKVVDHRDTKTYELSSQRRTAWLAKITRKDFKPTKYTRICSKHFISGKPSDLFDSTNPDWVPSQHLGGYCRETSACSSDADRYKRGKVRERKRPLSVRTEDKARADEQICEDDVAETPATCATENDMDCENTGSGENDMDCENTGNDEHGQHGEADLTIKDVQSEMQRLLNENFKLREDIANYELNEESFRGNEEKIRFYTGLPNFLILTTIFNLVAPHLPSRKSLSKFQQIIITLMRLRLNLSIQDLAWRFRTSKSTISRTFTNTIGKMYDRLKFLIMWPAREDLRLTMPVAFRRHFGKKVVVILDCFEVFIEKPSGFEARCQTWSNYKHHNTIKFLIGITPQGTVSYISNAWGGRASDKLITEQCGIVSQLLPGDVVMADRGFDISCSVGLMCAEVKIPAFTRGQKQLSPLEGESTRRIANVRIHVERVIGLVRNKYTILQGVIPIDYLKSEAGECLIDKISIVCCALINVCDPIVPFD